MAIWKETTAPKKEGGVTIAPEPALKREPDTFPDTVLPQSTPRRSPTRSREGRESVIGSEMTIEGKIDGTGHIRLAGRFKGDVNIQGDLTIEQGAKLTGSVKANSVIIGG